MEHTLNAPASLADRDFMKLAGDAFSCTVCMAAFIASLGCTELSADTLMKMYPG